MMCRHCDGKGLIRVRYESGEQEDVALCICPHGKYFRVAGEAFVRGALRLSEDAQVAELEAFEDLPIAAAVAASFTDAGKVRARPKL